MKTLTILSFSILSFFISLFLTAFLIQHTFLFIPADSLNITYIEIVLSFLKYLFTDWIFLLIMIVLGIYTYTKRHSITDAIDINIIGKSTKRTYIVIGVFIAVFAITGSFGSHFPVFLFLGLFSALFFPVYCFFITYYILRKKSSSKEVKVKSTYCKNNETNYLMILVYLGLTAEIGVSVYLFSYYRSISVKGSVILFLSILLIFFVCFHPLSRLHSSNLLFIFSITLLCLSVQMNAFSGILFPKQLSVLISCLMFLLTCSVIYFSMKKDRMIEKNKFEQKAKEIAQQQINSWNKQNTQLLHLKHDCLHALTETNKLIQNGQNEEASHLLEKLSSEIIQNNEKIYCNDIYINSLLQSKKDIYDNASIETDIHLNALNSSFALDICLILSELTDFVLGICNSNNIKIIVTEQAGTVIIKTKWQTADFFPSFHSDIVTDVIHQYHGVMEIKNGDISIISILLIMEDRK